MLHIQINNIFQSESSSPTSLPITNGLSFQSPFKAVNASPNGHPVRGRSHRFRRKATWISAEIDAFLCSRSNVYAISSASFNATRPFYFTLVTVLRASTLVPTYVSSNSYVTYSHIFSSICCLDVNRRTSPRKSDSSCLFLWFSSGVLVCLSYVDPFISRVLHLNFELNWRHKSFLKSVIKSIDQVRIGRIAGQYAKPRSSSYERVGDCEVLSFRFVIFFLSPVPRYRFIVIKLNWHFLHGCLVLQGVIMLTGIVFFNLGETGALKL